MAYNNEYKSFYSILGLEPGYNDLLFIVKNDAIEPFFNFNINQINYNYCLRTSNISFEYEQNSSISQRFAGEGNFPNNLAVQKQILKVSLEFPLLANSSGYIDHAFSALWDLACEGYQGTPTAALSGIKNSPAQNLVTLPTNSNAIYVKNIAEFADIPTPFQITLASWDNSEGPQTTTVTAINRTEKFLQISPSTAGARTIEKTFIYHDPVSTTRKATFTLVSLREGVISNCIVDNISININTNGPITVKADIFASNIDRSLQPLINNNLDTFRTNINKIGPLRQISGINTKLSYISANSGNFDLYPRIDDKFVTGFQGTTISSFQIQEINLTLSNQIDEIFTKHSIHNNLYARKRNNIHPFLMTSNGQKFEGSIKYFSPISAFTMAEILSGPSSLNGGGIRIDTGDFKINLQELVWTPVRSLGNVLENTEEEIKFQLLSESFIISPVLEFSNDYS